MLNFGNKEKNIRPLLEVKNLVKRFSLSSGKEMVSAVENVSFRVFRGRTLGLVGESGSGKTTIAQLILRIIPPTAGQIIFDGTDIERIDRKKLFQFRRESQMVFQDSYSSLDPKMRVGRIIMEPLDIHRVGTRAKRIERIAELLQLVQLRPEFANLYPQQLSGGQRQRVGIARALALDPRLLVCDEPASALDVSIQAQILNLLRSLQRRLQLTTLFISHDLAVVRFVADDIAVLYLGKLVEIGPKSLVLREPKHPYTRVLLSAVPKAAESKQRVAIVLKGEIPSAVHPPSGCRFHTRCPIAQSICHEEEPVMSDIDSGHLVACHFGDSASNRMRAMVST